MITLAAVEAAKAANNGSERHYLKLDKEEEESAEEQMV